MVPVSVALALALTTVAPKPWQTGSTPHGVAESVLSRKCPRKLSSNVPSVFLSLSVSNYLSSITHSRKT